MLGDGGFLAVAVGFQGRGLSHTQASSLGHRSGDLRPSGPEGYLASVQRPEEKE